MLDGPPQSGSTTDGWKYLSDQLTIAIITGYTGSNHAVVIPSLINGLRVTGIGPLAFLTNYNLISVTIPNSVTSIGDDAFYSCTNLTNVAISDSVTNIGDFAFYYCQSLTSINNSATVSPALGSAHSRIVV